MADNFKLDVDAEKWRGILKSGAVLLALALPLAPDTATRDQLSKTNSLVMYDNVMNKFRYGNFKHAKYLDHESTTMFYPVMVTTFYDLITGLVQDGHPDLAKKALQKYDEELPDLYTGLDVVDRGNLYGPVNPWQPPPLAPPSGIWRCDTSLDSMSTS